MAMAVLSQPLSLGVPKSTASHHLFHHLPTNPALPTNPVSTFTPISQGIHSNTMAMTAKRSLKLQSWAAKASSQSSSMVQEGDWGEPISLGTAKLPQDVDLIKLETLLFQWGNSLTQNASLPLPVPIKVDKVKNGVRLGYIKVTDGIVEDLVHIDILVFPATTNSGAMFRALRSGRLKDVVPPGERAIMQSLLQALKVSIDLARA